MCGIFGYDFSKLSIDASQLAILALSLAISNDTRGGQGFGYAGSNGDSDPKVSKGNGKIANKTLDISKLKKVFCHTRYATHGKICKENNHPFELKHLIGCHNGVLGNHKELNEKYKRDCVVDSQHLFLHMLEDRDFSDICGYGVIVWIDKNKPNRIYFCQLDGGEFAVYQVKIGDSKAVVFSSSEEHLLRALERAQLSNKSGSFDIVTGKVYYIEDGNLYETKKEYELGSRYERSWKLGSMANNANDKILVEKWDDWEDWDNEQDLDDDPVSLFFQSEGIEEEVYLDEIDLDCSIWSDELGSYVTTEKHEDFLLRMDCIDYRGTLEQRDQEYYNYLGKNKLATNY